MTDNYKSRDYTIAITLQEGEYIGEIYYKYQYGGYGLELNIMEGILNYMKNLDHETIDDFNEEGLLDTTCALRADINGKHIHFTLRNPNGEFLNKRILPEELENHITGYNMVKCEGHGKKKERRQCISCKNFTPSEVGAKGFCSVREEKVARSRIICAFDYISKD